MDRPGISNLIATQWSLEVLAQIMTLSMCFPVCGSMEDGRVPWTYGEQESLKSRYSSAGAIVRIPAPGPLIRLFALLFLLLGFTLLELVDQVI